MTDIRPPEYLSDIGRFTMTTLFIVSFGHGWVNKLTVQSSRQSEKENSWSEVKTIKLGVQSLEECYVWWYQWMLMYDHTTECYIWSYQWKLCMIMPPPPSAYHPTKQNTIWSLKTTQPIIIVFCPKPHSSPPSRIVYTASSPPLLRILSWCLVPRHIVNRFLYRCDYITPNDPVETCWYLGTFDPVTHYVPPW